MVIGQAPVLPSKHVDYNLTHGGLDVPFRSDSELSLAYQLRAGVGRHGPLNAH